MSQRDEVRQQALVIATEIIDPEWHYDGFPAMARVLVDQILALEGIAVVDRKAELPDFGEPKNFFREYLSRVGCNQRMKLILKDWVKEDK